VVTLAHVVPVPWLPFALALGSAAVAMVAALLIVLRQRRQQDTHED
jgi:hypothetical protein